MLVAWRRGATRPWVITARGDDRPFGMIELRPSGHRAEIGYVLGRPWWGQGFMTEAARAVVEWGLAQPAMFRVWAVTDVDNVASARVIEANGGVLEDVRNGKMRFWVPTHPDSSAIAPRQRPPGSQTNRG